MPLEGVRVRHSSPWPAAFGAQSFAFGDDIHLATGGEQHLEHELRHVAQQRQGRVWAAGRAAFGLPFNADAALEAEADGGRAAPERTAASAAPQAVLQPKLAIGGALLADADAVKAVLHGAGVEWNVKWDGDLSAFLTSGTLFDFVNTKVFVSILDLPRSDVVQPPSGEDDPFGQCYAYSTVAAAQVSGHPFEQADLDRALTTGLADKSMGGGPGNTMRALGLSPATMPIAKGKPNSNSALVREALLNNNPIVASVAFRTKKGRGKHWLYVVDMTGRNLITRDQNNNQIMGMISLDDFSGESVDGKFRYTLTELKVGQARGPAASDESEQKGAEKDGPAAKGAAAK